MSTFMYESVEVHVEECGCVQKLRTGECMRARVYVCSGVCMHRRKGTMSLWAMTSSRYFCARFRLRPLRAIAASRVFLKCTRRLEPEALQALAVSTGSVEYFPILLRAGKILF
jgi:hypothetical protein